MVQWPKWYSRATARCHTAATDAGDAKKIRIHRRPAAALDSGSSDHDAAVAEAAKLAEANRSTSGSAGAHEHRAKQGHPGLW